MTTVRITGWRAGFQKIAHTKALQRMAGLSLKDAKDITDAILDGHTMSVTVSSDDVARDLVKRLQELGADATRIENSAI
jgi:ribosomal protein L7/L12